MEQFARACLEKLLGSGEKSSAGLRSLQASLTESKLADYRKVTSLQKKEEFEHVMRAARADGAIEILWDGRRDGDGFIKRVNLQDARKLSVFLGIPLIEDLVSVAKEKLTPHLQDHPVLAEIITRWLTLKKCRGFGPEDYQYWLDAIKTITECKKASENQAISLPVREFSASDKLFNDSKRIEKLISPLDVLLSGSIDSEIRDEASVLQELGLYREPRPVLLCGKVEVERTRVTSLLDTPYTGLPADTLSRVISKPDFLLTIENLTTFHSESRKRCDENVLVIYTAGMPSPAWQSMYSRLLNSLPSETPVYHWGDVDEGGFRIASKLSEVAKANGFAIQPWRMSPKDIPDRVRRKASQRTLERIKHFAASAGWAELGVEIYEAGFTVEQESLT